MSRVAVYLRMSDDKQERSIGDQRSECLKRAKAKHLIPVREYIDEAISGDDTERRVAFQQMIADAPSGAFEGVLCWDIDRFGRFDAIEAGYWIKPLRDNGIWLETCAQGRIDWNDFAGRLVYSVTQEAKHAYLRDLSRNVTRGMLSAAKQGKVLSNLPYGYRSDAGNVVIIDDEAEVVREIFRLCLDGVRTRQIPIVLNERGIPAPLGGKWAHATVTRTLKREAYLGTFIWNATSESKYSEVQNGDVVPVQSREAYRHRDRQEQIRLEGHHESIIDAATFSKVQVILRDNRKHTSPKTGFAAFILSGMLFCGSCGAVMYGRKRPYEPFEKYYVCSMPDKRKRCEPRKATEPQLIQEIARQLAERFAKVDISKEVRRRLDGQTAKPGARDASRRLAAVRQKLDRSKRRLLECDSDMLPIVQKRIRELNAEAAGIESLCAAGPISQADIEERVRMACDLYATLPNLCRIDPSKARHHLRQIITKATAHTTPHPGKHPGYTLNRVELQWL